jgi:uncharacterized membrane protein YfcA
MRDDPRWWPWSLGVFAIGAVFGWLLVARLPSDPYGWIGAIAMTLGAVVAVWKMARSGTQKR